MKRNSIKRNNYLHPYGCVHDLIGFSFYRYLRALASRIQRNRYTFNMKRILHARVPIIKFHDALTDIECDISIGRTDGRFKSCLVGLLAQYDWRVSALVRLVKCWARYNGINDAADGTLNSYGLTMMVIFHLQTRSPRVLPTFKEMFGNAESRPLEGGKTADFQLLRIPKEFLEQQCLLNSRWENKETLFELFTSFLALWRGILTAWSGGGDGGLHYLSSQYFDDSKEIVAGLQQADLTKGTKKKKQKSKIRKPDLPEFGNACFARLLSRVRVDTWHGTLRFQPWDGKDGKYVMSIEDPLDSTDNCSRSVLRMENVWKISRVFRRSCEFFEKAAWNHDSCNPCCAVLASIFGEKDINQMVDALHSDTNGSMHQTFLDAFENGVTPSPLSIPTDLSHICGYSVASRRVTHTPRDFGNNITDICAEPTIINLLFSAETSDALQNAIQEFIDCFPEFNTKLGIENEILRIEEDRIEAVRLERRLHRNERRKQKREAKKAEEVSEKREGPHIVVKKTNSNSDRGERKETEKFMKKVPKKSQEEIENPKVPHIVVMKKTKKYASRDDRKEAEQSKEKLHKSKDAFDIQSKGNFRKTRTTRNEMHSEPKVQSLSFDDATVFSSRSVKGERTRQDFDGSRDVEIVSHSHVGIDMGHARSKPSKMVSSIHDPNQTSQNLGKVALKMAYLARTKVKFFEIDLERGKAKPSRARAALTKIQAANDAIEFATIAAQRTNHSRELERDIDKAQKVLDGCITKRLEEALSQLSI